jgi:hypothetical protein
VAILLETVRLTAMPTSLITTSYLVLIAASLLSRAVTDTSMPVSLTFLLAKAHC